MGDRDDGHYCRSGYHDEPHYGCYINHGCRCGGCKRERSDVRRAMKERARAKDPPEHGTRTGYDYYGCRCDPCTAAEAEYAQDYRSR